MQFVKSISGNSAFCSLFGTVSWIAIACTLLGTEATAADHVLTIAVSLDIPPYVMNHANRGVEVYIMHMALPNYKVKWMQMDYQALETAVSDEKADIAVSVQTRKPDVFYSEVLPILPTNGSSF